MADKNYPKMLYQGNLQVFKTAIADNEDHESELKEQDWIEYGDLKEPEAESQGVAHGVSNTALEGLDDIKQELVDVTQERDELRTENERLNDIITKGSAENIELRKQLRFKELEDKSAEELKTLLTEVGVSFKANDGKPVLAQLLLDHEASNQN